MTEATQPMQVPGAELHSTFEVRQVIFAAPDDGFAVAEAQDEQTGDVITLTGPLAHLDAGRRAEVTGEWVDHQTYGPQLKVRSALPLDPADDEGRLAYLTTLKHIGEARARRLLDAHGERIMDVIAADPVGTFMQLRGLSRKQAESAAESWYSSRAVRDLHVDLAPHGLAHLAARLHARYGDEAREVLHSDPYRLTEIEGVGFTRADRIALASDVPPESDRRAQAAALYAIGEAEAQGSTYMPEPELAAAVERLTGHRPGTEVLLGARGLAHEADRVYRRATLEREVRCAEALRARAAGRPRFEDAAVAEARHGTSLTDEQWAAVRLAVGSRLSIITGGPGVGKTECTREVVAAAEELGATIGLCAPTGRAARRLQEATGHEAMTIHRMLEWRPGSEPGYGPEHPHPAEIVVVDESSMLNLQLLEVLLNGLAEASHVVFVGDADQLPPVGAGKPFADMMDSGVVPVTRLTHIFRQAARSMITTAAHAINRGLEPSTEPGPEQLRDFSFMERATPEGLLDQVVELVAERVPQGLGLDPARDVQVLAPMYLTPIGINALNERLRRRINPDGREALRGRFRIGDRLIQTRNSHQLGLMNGSICLLTDDDPEEEAISIETDDGGELVVSYDEAETLRLAYAISVHKAQGCEVPVAVFVCHGVHRHMLTRPLVYTAVTRARQHCVVAGTRDALAEAVRRDDSSRRHSALAERLAPRPEAATSQMVNPGPGEPASDA